MVRGLFFSDEYVGIVVDALVFTKEKLLEHYSTMSRQNPRIIHADIERAEKQDKVTEVLRILEDRTTSGNLGFQRTQQLNNVIFSALKIYNIELQKAKDSPIQSVQNRIQAISEIINDRRFTNSKNSLYNFLIESKTGSKEINETTQKRLFFSYSSRDKIIVGKISDHLEQNYPYEVFRAHEDIEPDLYWRDVIKTELKSCEGMITLVTISFRRSAWTQQEVGWALSRGIPMFSLYKMKKIPELLEEK